MTVTPPPAMEEVTRLTRRGRIAEATLLLRRLLGGQGTNPGGTPGAPAPDATPGRPRMVIDMEPAAPGPAPAAMPPLSRLPTALRGALGRLGQLGLRPGPQTGSTEPLPQGARFLAENFADEAGSRGYRLYIPSTWHGRPAPLIVMLHGCTQSPEDFAAGTGMNALAEAHGCLIAYPGQSQAANVQKCWNWFNPADQRRDRGEPALIAGITRQVLREHRLDPRRVYIAGLSAGGAQAAIMGQAYPELYAAIGVHSGLACGAARDMPGAFAAMRQGAASVPVAEDAAGRRRILPTIVFHADADATVHPRNGDQVIAQSEAADARLAAGLRSEVERGRVPGGHAYTRSIRLDAAGRPVLEQWVVHGGGHAWSGGNLAGSFTDPLGPDASRAMLRFFFQHRRAEAGT